MTPEKWRKVEELYQGTDERPHADRRAFLDEACGNDFDLRREVESRLSQSVARTGMSDQSPAGNRAEQSDPEELQAGCFLNHFEVRREIGRGGMGVVYLAQDCKLNRQVALKLLPPGLHRDAERLRRFEREARLAAALNHSNIVTVFEIGEWKDRPFIATEYVEGETLTDVVARGPVAAAEAVRVGGQILAALAVAHNAGIVHRDLKPANVMVRSDGGVKVLDFGLARLMQPDETLRSLDETRTMQTVAGQILGTPAYMAPEQWEGRPADARTDIYAFGCILYEMLSGRRATHQRPSLPSRPLEKIISRCLERDPTDRWQSAASLQVELGSVTRSRQYWREAGIAAAGVILVLGAVFAWRQHSRAALLTDKDVVVLSDFTNTTGDPVFDGTLRQALAIQLEQSPFLKVMDDAQMRQDLRLMQRSPAEHITSQLAHDICGRDGAAATIEGAIANLGKAYVITLQAINCKDGATLAREQSQADDKEHVLGAVDKTASAMRATLGESLPSIEKLSRPLEQFSTSSLEALQQYSRGYIPQSQGQFLTAIPFFQRAIDLDPKFAWAYLALSLAYSNAGDGKRSIEFQRKAFELSDRVSEFERLSITAREYWRATGELDKSLDYYRQLSGSYPRNWGTRSEANLIYVSMGEFEKAVEEGNEAVRLGPYLEPPYRNLASAYISLDRLQEAEETLAKARAKQLDGSRLHQRLLELAYIKGDQAAAGREIQWYSGKPEEYMSFGLQAANADALGRRREASELYRRAAESASRRRLGDAAAGFDEADALADALLGNCRTVQRAGRPLLAPPLALATCGDAVAAEKLAAETSKLFPNGTLWNAVQLPAIRAASELKRDQPAKAIDLLSLATPYERAYPEVHYLRGLAYLRLRKGTEAGAEFRKILDHKGANWGLFYAMSEAGLGHASALAGDASQARQAYQQFFALWKDADSDAALLGEARKEFAALQ